MSPMLRGSALFLCLILILLALPVMAQVSQPNADERVPQTQTPGSATQAQPAMTFHTFQHGVPWRDPNGPAAAVGFAAPAGAFDLLWRPDHFERPGGAGVVRQRFL